MFTVRQDNACLIMCTWSGNKLEFNSCCGINKMQCIVTVWTVQLCVSRLIPDKTCSRVVVALPIPVALSMWLSLAVRLPLSCKTINVYIDNK